MNPRVVWQDLNLQPLPPQGSALPTAPHPDLALGAVFANFLQDFITHTVENLCDSNGVLFLNSRLVRGGLRGKTSLIAWHELYLNSDIRTDISFQYGRIYQYQYQ